MLNEFAIPQGSKLYFLDSAKQKRKIENICIDIFYKYNFEEIITPFFSYHQLLDNKTQAISFSDSDNHQVSLRADSSQDIVRLITKRLGKSTSHKKWFYIQPIFNYPTTEINQIGIEWIDNNGIDGVGNLLIEILDILNIEYFFQIGNMQIPKLISQEYNIKINYLINHNIEKLLSYKIKWLEELMIATSIDDIYKLMDKVPNFLKDELNKLIDGAKKINTSNVILTPLYYSKNEYYNGLFFRVISKNKDVISLGGTYTTGDVKASGFAIYTDELICD
jgi:histidyl-tRNA synthetase